jgi:hypothetical protein
MGSRGVQDTEGQESANMQNLWRRGRRHNQAGLPSRAWMVVATEWRNWEGGLEGRRSGGGRVGDSIG